MSARWSNSWPYEVGYKKPPKRSRFKPGVSGNPRGRPRNAKGLKQLLHEALDNKPITVNEGGDSHNDAKERADRASSNYRNSIKGDTRSTALLLREANDTHAWGKEDKENKFMELRFVEPDKKKEDK